jgi:hypothetical protein
MTGKGVAAAAIMAAGAAWAVDLTPLYAGGDWSVAHGYDPVRRAAWCAAETVNGAGQGLGVTAHEDGAAEVFVADADLADGARVVRFSIDIDDKHWSIEGAAGAGAVSVLLDGNESAGWFLRELSEGASAAVRTESGAPVATFSLAGARDALEELAACRARILPHGPLHEIAFTI